MQAQLLALALIFAAAGGGWAARDDIGQVLAKLRPDAPSGTAEKSGRDKPARSSKRAARGAAPVIVAPVTTRRDDNKISAIGTARARRAVTLYADAEGEVISVNMTAGQRVAKDDTLVTLVSMRSRLAVDMARKSLQDAEQRLKRVEFLKNRNVNSGASVEDATIAVERAMIDVKTAEENLRDRRVDAPFDGFVGIPRIEPGDRVSAGMAIATLDDRSELYVEFPVPEKFLARLDLGQNVRAVTPSYARETFQGRLGYIDSRIDPTSRTVTVRAVIPNAQDKLRPGMSFAVELALPGEMFLSVPELALQWGQGDSYIWVVDGDKVKRTSVEMVRRMNDVILIDGDVREGDLVVVEGVQRLRDGKPVSFEPLAPKPAAPAALRPDPGTAGTQSERRG